MNPDKWTITEKKVAFWIALAAVVSLKLWGLFGEVPWWAVGLVAFAGVFFEPETTAASEFPPQDSGSLAPDQLAGGGVD